jgi:outer membrane lipoprotein SlyB
MPKNAALMILGFCLVPLVSACEPVASGSTAPAQPAVGTLGGAAAGGALGSMLGSGSGRTASIVGGALLGGIAGNQLVDRPVEEQQRMQAERSRDLAVQRQLDYERQSKLQADQVAREIEERRLFEEWKRERAGGSQSGSSAGS